MNTRAIRQWWINSWLGYRLKRWRDNRMASCRVCGSSKEVIAYDPRGIWAYPIRNTYCPEHCPEHDFNRHSDGTYCDTCGSEPPYDWY